MKIIGIVAKHKNETRMRSELFIRDEVKQAIFDNNAIAIGILYPNDDVTLDLEKQYSKNFELISKQIKLCSGVVLQGGNANDLFELEIAKYCHANNIPLLAICAGQNCLVKAMGGSITEIKNPNKHNNPVDDYVHKITIKENSNFHRIVNTLVMPVNSRHKNTISNPGVLTISAICEDGYIDVVEDSSKKFYMGVRFHPESLYKTDERMNNIFMNFISSCENTNDNLW